MWRLLLGANLAKSLVTVSWRLHPLIVTSELRDVRRPLQPARAPKNLGRAFSPVLLELPAYGMSTTAQQTLLQREFIDRKRATMGSLASRLGSVLYALVAREQARPPNSVRRDKCCDFSFMFSLSGCRFTPPRVLSRSGTWLAPALPSRMKILSPVDCVKTSGSPACADVERVSRHTPVALRCRAIRDRPQVSLWVRQATAKSDSELWETGEIRGEY